MLDYLGKPLLLHTVDRLRVAGVDDFVFVVAPQNVSAVQSVVDGLEGVACHIVQQDGTTGMAGAMVAAEGFLDGPVLVVSSNDVVEIDAYRMVLAAGIRDDVAACLLARRVREYFPGGYMVADSTNRVSAIVEKPDPGAEPSEIVNVVVHYLKDGRVLCDALSRVDTQCDDRYEKALGLMISEGHVIRSVPYEGAWNALKYPWHVFGVMESFLDSIRTVVPSSARIAKSAVLSGNVLLGEGVRILENAVIRGPAYIGDNTVIGNNVLIRGGAHIGAGSVVGYCTEVKHSYVGRDCWFHSNYVGDSIIDDGCSFGSGAVTANLRLDEGGVRVAVDGTRQNTGLNKLGVIMGQKCRVGINASLMPGIRVGKGAHVGAHVCLRADLPAGKMAVPLGEYGVVDVPQAATELRRESGNPIVETG